MHCSTLTHQPFLSGGHLNIQLYHFKNRKLQSIQYILFFSASISYCARHQQYRTSEKYCSMTELNHMNIKTSSYSSISQRFIHLSLADNIRRWELFIFSVSQFVVCIVVRGYRWLVKLIIRKYKYGRIVCIWFQSRVMLC